MGDVGAPPIIVRFSLGRAGVSRSAVGLKRVRNPRFHEDMPCGFPLSRE